MSERAFKLVSMRAYLTLAVPRDFYTTMFQTTLAEPILVSIKKRYLVRLINETNL